MADARTLQRSFAGGEMSPSMVARVDDIRFQNGYASARNFEVLPTGSLRRRPGLRHVRRCKYNDKRSRLIPFKFSVSQTMQIEFGEKYFRFHQNNGTLLWATPKVIASVSAANDTITFTARHGLANDTPVQFMAEFGGTIPGGLAEGTTYYVRLDSALTDAKTIQVRTSPGPGAAFNIDATVGVGTSRMFLDADMPEVHFTSRNFLPAAVNTGTEVIDLTTAHGFLGGEAIRFTNSGGGLPTATGGGLTAGVTYYVIANTASTIKVARTAELAQLGTAIDFLTQGTGTHKIHRLYTAGDLVHQLNGLGGIFYCRDEVASDVDLNADTQHWYQQPDEGVYEVPHPYLETHLPAVTYSGSYDVVSLTHRDEVLGSFQTTGDTDVNPATDEITKTAHGLMNGDRLRVASSGALPAATPALSATTNYFVVQATVDTFKIATSIGGTPIDITADAAGVTLTWTTFVGALADLRREGALRWTYRPVSFAPQLAAPVIGSVTRTFGEYQEFTSDGATPTIFTTVGGNISHGLNVGDGVFAESVAGGIGGGGSLSGGLAANYFEVAFVVTPAAGLPVTQLRLKKVAGGASVDAVTAASVFMRYADINADTTQRYKVTAVTEDGLESQPSASVSANNNLSVHGSSNLVSWSAVAGAAKYYIYKEQDQDYGLIGQADAGNLTFKDEYPGIPPDMKRTLGVLDTTLGTGVNSPAAITRFEQRRVLGGTPNFPNGIWATRSSTETDLTYHIPLQDDDRLRFNLVGDEAVEIRHLVPMQQLLVLTDSTEFRIVPVDTDVLTPSSIDAKVQSYQGCSIVRPTVASNNLIFCAARGGHVFEMGYLPQQGGLSKPGDLCHRSAHLFDGHVIEDQAQSKAPYPMVWFASPSSALLLGLTYVPDDSIGAWHAHSTGASGVFESCSVIAEGDEDARYFVVRRTIAGQTVRSVEVMSTERFDSLAEAYFVDAGGSFDDRNTGATTMTVTGGSTWAYGDAVTITSSTIQFTLGSSDVGDLVVLTAADGTTYRIRITAVLTNATATGFVLDALPASLRSAAVTTWAFARDTITGLDHLEGETVLVFGDGLVQDTRVVSGGSITPASPAAVGCVGLAMPASVRFLPLGLQTAEAWGQGRTKNVSEAALRVVESGAFLIGPNETDLVPANVEAVPGSLITDEARVVLLPEWTEGGQITLQIEDPLPLELLGLVLKVAVGD